MEGSEGSIFHANRSIICGKQGCSHLRKHTVIYEGTLVKSNQNKVKHKAKNSTQNFYTIIYQGIDVKINQNQIKNTKLRTQLRINEELRSYLIWNTENTFVITTIKIRSLITSMLLSLLRFGWIWLNFFSLNLSITSFIILTVKYYGT